MSGSEIHTRNHPGKIFLQGSILGSVGLSLFYYVLLFLVTGDPRHPVTQFTTLQPWMGLLIAGFGIQMGLFMMMRNGIRFDLQQKQDSTMAAGTSTAVSGMAMVACCAHHAVEVLPILGLSAFAIFLAEYQTKLLILGVIANVAGIGLMLWFISGKATPEQFVSYIKASATKEAA